MPRRGISFGTIGSGYSAPVQASDPHGACSDPAPASLPAASMIAGHAIASPAAACARAAALRTQLKRADQVDDLLREYRVTAKALNKNPSTTNNKVHVLKKFWNWLDVQAVGRQPIPHGLDSLEKLLNHPDRKAVQEVIDFFKDNTTDKWVNKSINGAITDLREWWPGIAERMAVSWQDSLPDSALVSAASPGRQGELTDSEVLDIFRQKADAHPDNTEMTKTYYRDVT